MRACSSCCMDGWNCSLPRFQSKRQRFFAVAVTDYLNVCRGVLTSRGFVLTTKKKEGEKRKRKNQSRDGKNKNKIITPPYHTPCGVEQANT